MCKFMIAHPNWYVFMLSMVEIVGEAAPIVVIFTIQVVFQIYKRSKQRPLHPYDKNHESHDPDLSGMS